MAPCGVGRWRPARIPAKRSGAADRGSFGAAPHSSVDYGLSVPFTVDVVTIENETLAVRLGNLYAVSTPFTEENTIRVELIPGRGQVFAFELDEEGRVTGARLNEASFEQVSD